MLSFGGLVRHQYVAVLNGVARWLNARATGVELRDRRARLDAQRQKRMATMLAGETWYKEPKLSRRRVEEIRQEGRDLVQEWMQAVEANGSVHAHHQRMNDPGCKQCQAVVMAEMLLKPNRMSSA